ncbi:diaminopimelate decarboxylase [Sphingomonas jejuensis]|uniref:Diaminopimelate decarboxylase n=1 Tax=Sphingomonas jejuensis TaxID=904715 RepID=A0ABX0XNL7_9SPHN|nr:diaminopimelate decarboxylase [Sphingomonas jejuensis]NJC34978.1 diaminopimelate decarboxylase [Sphingomonas jejuensis]
MDHFEVRDGRMFVEDVCLDEIADAVGTPVYVYSTATLERHAAVFRQAVAGLGRGDPLVAFAVKANPNGAVLATLGRAGLGADVVSGGEVARARAAGIAADRILFSGVGKTAAEMRDGLEAGILQFNLESQEEARLLSEVAVAAGRTADIAFRINPDVDAGTHAKISTGRADNKFGIPAADARAAYATAASLPGLRVTGVTVHIGSQLFDLAPLAAAFGRLGTLIGQLRADGHHIELADLGGGLGVPYDPALPPPPTPADYGAMVAQATAGWDLRLAFEPGRLIVGNAGVLLASVVRVKPGAEHPWVIVDAGMNDLIRPSLYDAWHDIRAVRPTGARWMANVVGPVCESGDTFATAREMDQVGEGDRVAFMTAGAYAATMASTYNSRPLTPEVLVSGSRWAVVRERQSLREMIAAERRPDWLTA